MDMDPNQLFLMEEGAAGYLQQTIPGMLDPRSTGGASRLAAASDPNSPTNLYASPIAGHTAPDISPLASLGLQNYGVGGMLAGTIGNSYLSSMMQQQGLLPMGNAGSYMQAYRTRNQLNMRQQVSKDVAGQDAESFYRTMRGAAALVGMPFDREQQQAARKLAETVAAAGPTLSLVAPELLDGLAGERGSVQAMAGQMMDANRYRVDPTTGRLGYNAGSNTDLVNGVFNQMFSQDNMAQMQGLKAGDVGQMYRQLAAEGLAGTRGNLRDRTITTLQQSREEGESLKDLGLKAGVDLKDDTNLESLSNADLTKLRQTSGVKAKLTQSDTRQITDQLQGYVSSIAAMREVFGENGDPNAPVPKLINALKNLTSGQMHRFDPKELNTMVRDMQSLSQMSGKSLDQLYAMTQSANTINTETLGRNGAVFNQTSTNVGVTTGMAFAERGAATGFGAVSREEAEQMSMRLFSRGMASEMGNAMGALSRVERAGGFSDNQAGRQMKAIMAAADIGAKTYSYQDDAGRTITADVPTKEMEFLAIAKRGAIEGMDAGGFAMMLGDRTSNQRALANDPDRQQAALRQQGVEIDKEITRVTANRISYADPLKDQIKDPRVRSAAAYAMGRASTAALTGLTQEQLQNEDVRNKAIADALTVSASDFGVTLTQAESMNMAASNFGQAEGVVKRFGFDSFTGKQAVLSPAMTAARTQQQAVVASRAGVNEAMSHLGPKGSFLTRLSTAVQKQGDRGGVDADISTLLGDMFAGDMDIDSSKLSAPMQDIKERKERIEKLEAQIPGASPEVVQNLRKDIKEQTELLNKATQNTHKLAKEMGLTQEDGKFNLLDISQGRQAANEMDAIGQSARVRTMATTSAVSDADRTTASGSKLSTNDVQMLATLRTRSQMELADEAAAAPIDLMEATNRKFYDERINEGMSEAGAREMLQKTLRGKVGDMAAQTKDVERLFGGTTVGNLSQEQQDAVIRGRRATQDLIPTDAETTERIKLLRTPAQQTRTKAERAGFSREEAADYDTQERTLTRNAERQLMAEKQLQALGQLAPDQTLTGDAASLDKYQKLDPELKAKLQAVAPGERAAVIDQHLDKQQLTAYLADATKSQREAVAFNQTDEGKRANIATERNIDALADVRKEYVQDAEAFSRGGVRGKLAVAQNNQAETELQTLANKYFDGKVGQMLNSQGRAMTDTGLAESQTEFDALAQDPKAQARVMSRLKTAGVTLNDPSELTVDHYRAYVGLQAKDADQSMRSSVEAMMGGATQTYADLLAPTDATRTLAQKLMGSKATEARTGGLQALSSAADLQGVDVEKTMAGLDVGKITQQLIAGKEVDVSNMTAEQQSLIKTASEMQSLTTLSRDQLSALESLDRRATEGADTVSAALGMSREEYIDVVKTGELQETPRWFETKEDLKAIQQKEAKLVQLEAQQAKDQDTIAKGLGPKELPAQVAEREKEIKAEQDLRSKRMLTAGFDPKSQVDVAQYLETVKTGTLKTTPVIFETKEELKAARQEASQLTKLETQQAQDQETLAKGQGTAELPEEIELRKKEIKVEQDRRDKRMLDVGLDPTDPDAVAVYNTTVKAGKPKESLRLFETKEELKAAQQDETRLSQLKAVQARDQITLDKGRGSTSLPSQIAQREKEIEISQARKDERMLAAGFDPADPAAVTKYNKRLVGQGQVEKLYEQAEAYKKDREALIAKGITPEEADKQLETIHKLSEKGAEQAQKAAANDLGSDSLNTLADAFGKTETEDRTKFRQTVGAKGGNTERNNALVAGALEALNLNDPKKTGDSRTAIEKLDKLTDDFKNDKTPEGRKKLAESIGVDVETLEANMRKTQFLGLDKKDEKYTDMDYESALKAKSGVDVAKEVKEEENRTLRITGGTVEVRGDITGQMTVHEMVAVGGSR